MRYDILMRIELIKPVYEIIPGKDECSEFVITFSCGTPLNESDTCAMLARYFDGIYFETHNSDTFVQKEDVFEMQGIIRVYMNASCLQDIRGSDIDDRLQLISGLVAAGAAGLDEIR